MSNNSVDFMDDDCEISAHDVREQLVEAGDFDGLLNQILNTPPALIDLKLAFSQIQRAIDVASKGEPYEFQQRIFQLMSAFSTTVWMRLRYLALKEISYSDVVGADRGMPLSHDLINRLLPQIQQLQTHLAELMQAWASTSRQWGLVRRRRARKTKKTNRTEKPQKASQARKSKPGSRFDFLSEGSPN